MSPIPRKKTKPDRQEDPDSASDNEESEEVRHSQPGSIVRLKFMVKISLLFSLFFYHKIFLQNLMQYTETEFQCGPNLNVIIGPNGSGKSR